MNRYFIIFFFCLLASNSIAQDLKEKNEAKEETILPSNKTALNDLLEETKKKMADAEIKVKSLTKYSKSLVDYKEKLKNFEANRINSIFSDLATVVSSNKNDEIILQENQLLSFFQPLYFYYRILTTNDDDNPISSDFTSKMNDALKPIKDNSIINSLTDNHFSDNIKPTLDKIKLESLKTAINEQTISDIKEKLIADVDGEISINTKNIDIAIVDSKNLKSTRTKILEKLNEQETQINDLAIKLGLPLFCLTILLLFLVPTFVKSKIIGNSPINSQNSLVEISTVLLLTMTILILGLSGKIQGDVLGTLIGGISGYVLNRIRTRNDNEAVIHN